MPLDDDLITRATQAFDPLGELNERNVEALYTQRPDSPARRAARRIQRLQTPSRFVLVGARGAGKTSELAALAHNLKRSHLVIFIDLAPLLPARSDTFALLTVLALVLDAHLHSWLTAHGAVTRQAQPPQEPSAQLLSRIGYLVEQGGKLAQSLAATLKLIPGDAAESGAVLQLVGQAAQSAGPLVSTLLASRDAEERSPTKQQDDRRALMESINRYLDQLQATTPDKKPPVLLLDGLDRRPDLESLELAFKDLDLFTSLQTSFVLTGPIPLRHLPAYRRVAQDLPLEVLHNLQVYDPSHPGVCDPAAFQVFDAIYRARCKSAALPEDLIPPDLLQRAALYSSGIVRDFLRFITEALFEADLAGSDAITHEHMDAALKRQRHDLQARLNDARIQLLMAVLQRRTLPDNREADDLLMENFIVCYANGDAWFRPHELIAAYIQTFEAGAKTPL